MSFTYTNKETKTKEENGFLIVGQFYVKDCDLKDCTKIVKEYIDIHYRIKYDDNTLDPEKLFKRIEGDDLTAEKVANPDLHTDMKTYCYNWLAEKLEKTGSID